MSFTIVFITALIVFFSVVLILFVLIQNPKDEGMSSAMGFSNGLQNLVGAARASNFIEKSTFTLAALLFSLVLLGSYMLKQQYGKKKSSAVVEHFEQYEESSPKAKKNVKKKVKKVKKGKKKKS